MAGPRDRDVFLERTARALALPVAEVEARLSRPLRSSVRLNPLRGAPADTEAELRLSGVELEPIPWALHTFHLRSDKGPVVASPAFSEGRLFLQNA